MAKAKEILEDYSDRTLTELVAEALASVESETLAQKIVWPSEEECRRAAVTEDGANRDDWSDCYNWLKSQLHPIVAQRLSENIVEAEATARFGAPTLDSEMGVHWCRYKDAFKQGVEWAEARLLGGEK